MPYDTITFIDIVFPQNIFRLTYILPESLVDTCNTGAIVEAPLRGKAQYGVVVRKYSDRPSLAGRKRLLEIKRVVNGFSLSRTLVDLLKWVSEYYMSSEGLALKSLLFADAFYTPGRKTALKKRTVAQPTIPLSDKATFFDDILSALMRKSFQTLLFHSKSLLSEIALVIHLVYSLKNIIIIVPERHDLAYYLPYLDKYAKDRFCTLHGGMSKSAKRDSYMGLCSGTYDIVIGTMQTVFAPIAAPSLIIVTKEQSVYYKHEETPSYNVRDVAVKRGSLDNTPVLLTSLSPSFESYFNCTKRKYRLIDDTIPYRRPNMHVINAAGSQTILTTPLKRKIHESLHDNKGVLLILNRKGHSILQCNECGHIDLCEDCEVPMVYHAEKVLRCHYCNNEARPPEECVTCRSTKLVSVGSGTERIHNLLKNEFGPEVLLIDSAHARGKSMQPLGKGIIIGTDLALRKISPFSRFGLVAILNADIAIHKPDFRIYEKLFSDIIYLSQYAGNDSDMIIQTYDWRNPFFSFLKKLNYPGFFNAEIKKREMFKYPPYTRIASLSIKRSSFNETYRDVTDNNIELLGPLYKRRGRKERIEFLIKSRPPVVVQNYIQMLLDHIAKDRKGLNIDIDPLVFT